MVRPIKPSPSPANNEPPATRASPQSSIYGSPLSIGLTSYHGNIFDAAPPGSVSRTPRSSNRGNSYPSQVTSSMPSSNSSSNTPEKGAYFSHERKAVPVVASPSPGSSPWRYRSSAVNMTRRPQFSNGEYSTIELHTIAFCRFHLWPHLFISVYFM